MSRPRKETVTCPKCGKESDITIWDTLNAEMNPKEKQQLLDGTIFRFMCECGYTAGIDAGMLYHNMTRHTIVYYVSEESVEQTENMFADIRKHGEFEMADYKYRIVTSQNALREKAAILENDLDDRVMELVKLFYYVHVHEQHPEEEIDEVLFFTEGGQWLLQFLGSASMTAELPVEFYEKIRDQYAARLEEAGNEGLHINARWAVRFLGYDED